MNCFARRIAALALWAAPLVSTSVEAKDHFLTIGGGSSASNNQVSLEKNVLFLQHFLADTNLASLPHEIYFADGLGGARDLQFIDPAVHVPRVNQLLETAFNTEHTLTMH